MNTETLGEIVGLNIYFLRGWNMKKSIIVLLTIIFLFIGYILKDLILNNSDSAINEPNIRSKIVGIDVKENKILVLKSNKKENDPRVAEWIKIKSNTKIIKDNKKIAFNILRYSQKIEIWLSDEVIKKEDMRWAISIVKTINVIDTNKIDKQIPDDFNFILKYGVGAKNVLNTFEGTYTKDLILAGTYTAEFKITKEEMKEIFIKVSQIDVLEYPNVFVPTSNRFSYPSSSFYLEIKMNGHIKRITWNKNTMADTPKATKLKDLIYFIESIIEFNPDHKKFPEIEGGYM